MKLLHTTAQRRRFVRRVTAALPYVFTLIAYLATYIVWLNWVAAAVAKAGTIVVVAWGALAIGLAVASVFITVVWIGALYQWAKDLQIARRVERWIEDGADTYE